MVKRGPGYAIVFSLLLAQFLGGAIGAYLLTAWGDTARLLHYGATFPGAAFTSEQALWGEVSITFMLTLTILIPSKNYFSAAAEFMLVPLLFSFMLLFEGPFSGTSTNAARSFGPALISGDFSSFWIYIIGPFLGAEVGVFIYTSLFKTTI